MSYRKDMNYFLHLMQPDFYIIYNVLMYTNVFIMLGVLRLRYVFCCCCFFVLFYLFFCTIAFNYLFCFGTRWL